MIRKIVREPALVVGVVTAALGLAVLFGLDVTEEQTGGIVVFLGAVMALVRFLTTPSAEVVTQVKPDGEVVAGDAAALETGTPLNTVRDGGGTVVSQPVPIQPKLLNR